MKEYSGRTGIKKWFYTYEDSTLMIAFLVMPGIICVGLILLALWRF